MFLQKRVLLRGEFMSFPAQVCLRGSEPRAEHTVNVTSAKGRQIIMELRKLDVVLGGAVDGLRTLWNLIRAPDFDPVAEPDALSRMQPFLSQIALVKPHLTPMSLSRAMVKQNSQAY
ncbi:hypothetical protein L3X38_004210 [Prunus dulcis]|uniref:Uncharacterized protein n=1 Tax=Prunus dulcis TaxID=3755 RepID=A0AAD5F2Z4_PRUDU|nr:hypothetical protein L3X38_004210 [Prunus dulcis]